MSSELDLDLQLQYDNGMIPAASAFRQWLLTALDAEDRPVEITLRIVDEDESRELNLRYCGKDRPTNVLSFPFEVPPGVDCNNLGDLVICAPLVEREASDQGKTPVEHWTHLVIHGVLHLQGYDHQNHREAAIMESQEIHMLSRLGIADPYLDKASILQNEQETS